MSDVENNYTFDEVYETKIDNYYRFYDDFAEPLSKALTYLSKLDADKVLSKTFFIPFFGESEHFCSALIEGRNVAIISDEDLAEEQEAIVTILHEAGHSFLNHGSVHGRSTKDKQRIEDECWDQVRKWLPASFTSCIDKAEQQGSGSRGVQSNPDTD